MIYEWLFFWSLYEVEKQEMKHVIYMHQSHDLVCKPCSLTVLILWMP